MIEMDLGDTLELLRAIGKRVEKERWERENPGEVQMQRIAQFVASIDLDLPAKTQQISEQKPS